MHSSPAQLITLSYSPWSERARWALDHHRVPYEHVDYVPLIGAPLLRLRTRRFIGRVTVPTLVHDGQIWMDSYDIARHAERVGHGSALFGPEHEASIAMWNERSERALVAGRALTIDRLATDPEAKRDVLPSWIPEAVRPALIPLGALGIEFVRRKYRLNDELAGGQALKAMKELLTELRKALDKSGDYLLGSFSYADITMAAALHYVSPVADTYLKLRPAVRRNYTQQELVEQFGDLLAWRDKLYEKHRR